MSLKQSICWARLLRVKVRLVVRHVYNRILLARIHDARNRKFQRELIQSVRVIFSLFAADRRISKNAVAVRTNQQGTQPGSLNSR